LVARGSGAGLGDRGAESSQGLAVDAEEAADDGDGVEGFVGVIEPFGPGTRIGGGFRLGATPDAGVLGQVDSTLMALW